MKTPRRVIPDADMAIILSDRFRHRLERRLERVPSGCLEWRGSTNTNGYGKIVVRAGLLISTHNAAWIVHHRRRIASSMDMDHLCFNRLCAEVSHLQVVTPEENQRRRILRHGLGMDGVSSAATMRPRAGKYQVRWRERIDGQIKERGRTFETSDEAERFMVQLAVAA